MADAIGNVQFETLYDIGEAGCRNGFLVGIGLALMISSAVGWVRNRRLPVHSRPAAPFGSGRFTGPGPGVGVLFFGFWTLVAFAATWLPYWSLLRGIRTGQAQTLEGTVTGFQPAPSYKGTERFRLGDREFSYSRYATNQGFHTFAADGAPIANGAHLRIVYIDNHILRLEIERPGVTQASRSAAAR
jgi:hypothetical protein